jgi:hypothetical protein
MLYVSDGKNNVRVLSFPKGKLVQTLTDVAVPAAQCSDNSGNVYISDWGSNGSIVAYAHGGKSPIKTLNLNSLDYAEACSVDSTTGNVAAAAWDGTTGNVSIFQAGKGTSLIYSDPNISLYPSCAYDGSGNLYVGGTDSKSRFVLASLSQGSSSFDNISLPPNIDVEQRG